MAKRKRKSGASGGGSRRPPSRAGGSTDRRREAAQRIADEERRALRRRSFRLVSFGLVGLLAIGGYYLYLLHKAHTPAGPPVFLSPAPSLSQQPDLAGLQTGPAPWSTDTGTLRLRLEELRLPPSGGALHIHQHLDIEVDGKPVTVPAQMGINAGSDLVAPIHTHDDSGVIHVESATDRVFTLGEMFDVWGVRFTGTCLGSYCDSSGKDAPRLRVFIGGQLVRTDPRLLELSEHQEIVVTFGTKAQLPDPIPSRYGFSIGE